MAEPQVTMTRAQYEQLLRWSSKGATLLQELNDFYLLRKRIDLPNEVRRYTLAVRWENLPNRVPPELGIVPDQTIRIVELDRPPTPEDVTTMLEGEGVKPAVIFVSVDPNGVLGWYELSQFPWG